MSSTMSGFLWFPGTDLGRQACGISHLSHQPGTVVLRWLRWLLLCSSQIVPGMMQSGIGKSVCVGGGGGLASLCYLVGRRGESLNIFDREEGDIIRLESEQDSPCNVEDWPKPWSRTHPRPLKEGSLLPVSQAPAQPSLGSSIPDPMDHSTICGPLFFPCTAL